MKSKTGIPYLITNRHNVTGRNNETNQCLNKLGSIPNRLEIAHFKHSPILTDWLETADNHGKNNDLNDETFNIMRERIIKSEPLWDHEGTPVWHEHPTLKETADFVAIKLTDTKDVEKISFERKFSQPLKIGITEIVSVIGYPFGKSNNNFPVWANGTIASDPVLHYNDLPITLIDCRSRGGQSGSPVFLYRDSGMSTYEDGTIRPTVTPKSRFLGIYSGRIHADSDIGFVWHESAVYELIDSLP